MKILDRFPYFTGPTALTVGQDAVQVKPYQIAIWVSVSPRETVAWDPRLPRLPALLDLGHNHNFSIAAAQLSRWAGISPAFLPVLGAIRESKQRVPLQAAGVWIHPNRRGTREIHTGHTPFRLRLDEGIAVFADDTEAPRLPLLGLRAITDNRLHLAVNGDRCFVTLRTARRWWWPF